jgi:hypothetical protein
MAQGIAHGLAGDLEEVGDAFVGQLRGGGLVHVQVEHEGLVGALFVHEGAQGGGEGIAAHAGRGEAGEVGAGVGDGLVEDGLAVVEPGGGLGGVGGEELAGGLQGEAGRVEGLDHAVVQIAAEADAFFEGLVEQIEAEAGGLFGALAVVALLGERLALGGGGAGEGGEAAPVGRGGRRGGGGGGAPPQGQGKQRDEEHQGREAEGQQHALLQEPLPGGRRGAGLQDEGLALGQEVHQVGAGGSRGWVDLQPGVEQDAQGGETRLIPRGLVAPGQGAGVFPLGDGAFPLARLGLGLVSGQPGLCDQPPHQQGQQ